LQPFSTMSSLSDGWEPLEFPRIDRHTRYELVTDDGVQVVKATADNSASGPEQTGERAVAWYRDITLKKP